MRKPEITAERAETAPVAYRGELIPLVRSIRRELGLSTGDLLALSALLSFLPCKSPEGGGDLPIRPGVMTIVFPSNSALCERANGMDERVMRRHLARLREAGMIERRDSPTRKRFPVRIGGRVVNAYGFDLSPLIRRLPELRELKERVTLRDERVRALRMRALSERAGLIRDIGETEELVRMGRLLRRSGLTEGELHRVLGVISDIRGGTDTGRSERTQNPAPAVTGENPAPQGVASWQPGNRTGTPQGGRVDRSREVRNETHRAVRTETPEERERADRYQNGAARHETGKRSGTNGQNVRHIDPPQIDKKKGRVRGGSNNPIADWGSYREISSLFPDPPKTPEGLMRVLMQLGNMLRIPTQDVAGALTRIGLEKLMRVLEHLSKNHEEIRSPSAYLRKVAGQAGPIVSA